MEKSLSLWFEDWKLLHTSDADKSELEIVSALVVQFCSNLLIFSLLFTLKLLCMLFKHSIERLLTLLYCKYARCFAYI